MLSKLGLLTMSSYTGNCANNIPVRPTSKNQLLSPLVRYFKVFVNKERGGEFGLSSSSSTSVWFWDIRERGPPSDDIVANAGDIYIDTLAVPIDVYQKNTSTGWTSC